MKKRKIPTSEKEEAKLQFGAPILEDISISAQTKKIERYVNDVDACLINYEELKKEYKFGRKVSK